MPGNDDSAFVYGRVLHSIRTAITREIAAYGDTGRTSETSVDPTDRLARAFKRLVSVTGKTLLYKNLLTSKRNCEVLG